MFWPDGLTLLNIPSFFGGILSPDYESKNHHYTEKSGR